MPAETPVATTTPTTTTTTTPASSPAPTATVETKPAPSPAPEPFSNPSDTDNIARRVIAEIEEQEESAPEAPVAETAEVVQPDASAQVENTAAQSDDDPLKELGLKPRIDGKEHRIPESRVREMLAKKVKKAEEAAQAAAQTQIAEHTTKIQTYEDRLSRVEEVERVMGGNPAQFLQMLAQNSPVYAELLAPVLRGTASSNAIPADMPQPDYDLGNGSFTYSQEGLAQRLAWERQQAVQQAKAEMFQEFSPIIDQYRATQLDQMVGQQHAQLQQHIVQLGQSLPGFTENWQEIQKTFMEDKSIRSLEHAYDRFMMKKNAADRNTLRQELLNELRSQPASTSMTAGVTTSSASRGGPETTEQIARRILSGQ